MKFMEKKISVDEAQKHIQADVKETTMQSKF